MEFRRTILWMILVFSLFTLWSNWKTYNNPALINNNSEQVQNPATPNVPSAGTTSVTPNATKESASLINPDSEKLTFKSDVLELTFDTVGAQIIEAKLLKHHDSENSELPTTLLNYKDGLYTIQSGVLSQTANKTFPNQASVFKLVSKEEFKNSENAKIVFEAESDGVKVKRTYTLTKDSYDIKVNDEIINNGTEPVSAIHYLQITRDGEKPKDTVSMSNTYWGYAVYSDEEKFEKIPFSDIDDKSADYISKTTNGWISFIQHYFVTAWVFEGGKEHHIEFRKAGQNLYAASASQVLGTLAPQQAITTSSHLWVGPQDQKALVKVHPELNTVVNYGWLTFIAKPMFALMSWINTVIGNWGWTIVVLTIIIKLLLYPLSATSYRSMARMKNVAPRMKLLKEQYGDDKQKLNAAMMQLYRTEKINPLGGCLPILLQIPIFLTLYRVILSSVELRGAPWIGWITDLSVQDPYYILPILMILTMFLQMRMNPTPPDPTQAKIMMIMPLVFGAMMFFFPAGLVLYWTVNSLLSMLQQWYNTRRFTQTTNEKILTHK